MTARMWTRCAVALLLVACHEPADREPISDEQSAPDLGSLPQRSSHENEPAQDPQSLVGRNWNTVRPEHCRGETLLRSTEPLRTYVVPTWRGRTLYVYRAGGPIFELTHTDDDRQEKAQRMGANLEILGVVDLGEFDWKTHVISGAVFDDVSCWDPQEGGPGKTGLVVGVTDLTRVSYQAFSPDRAWKWNEQEGGFEAVADPARVSCWYQEQGDTFLEQSMAWWRDSGEANHHCEIAAELPADKPVLAETEGEKLFRQISSEMTQYETANDLPELTARIQSTIESAELRSIEYHQYTITTYPDMFYDVSGLEKGQHPYHTTGDWDCDGEKDQAVLLQKPGSQVVAVLSSGMTLSFETHVDGITSGEPARHLPVQGENAFSAECGFIDASLWGKSSIALVVDLEAGKLLAYRTGD